MKKAIALCLTLILCITVLPVSAAAVASGPSPWAAEEVNKAISMGFIPEGLQSDYQKEITKDEFAQLAVRFCQYQFGYASGIDNFLKDYRIGHVDANGNAVKAEPKKFIDATQWGTIASALGITNGKGGGKFNPNGGITRQEAATMLLRTYTAYSTETPTVLTGTENYADNGLFPSWAMDSIMWLKSWLIMKGDGNNTFNPAGSYTREQSIITFLRLDQYAPYSRSRGSIKPLVSYEESIRRILSPEDGSSFALTARYDKTDATILLGVEQSAGGEKNWRFWVVYTGTSDIGQIDLYPYAAINFPNPYVIGDITFNDSGSTMYYTVKAGEIQISYGFKLNYVHALPEISQPPTQQLQQLPAIFDTFTELKFDGKFIYTKTKDDCYAVYNLNGEQLFTTAPEGSLTQAGDGLFLYENSSGVVFYNSQGTQLNRTPYIAGTYFCNGIAAVQKDVGSDLLLIDKTGAVKKTVGSSGGTIFNRDFESNCVLLKNNDKKYLLNTESGAVVGKQYQDINPFSNGRAAVLSKDGWGYIDENFDLVIPCRYLYAFRFRTAFDLAVVKNQDSLFGAINNRGSNTTVPFAYKFMTEINSYGYALAQRIDGQCVLVSVQGAPTALPSGPLSSFRLFGKYIIQETNLGYKVINTSGETLFDDVIIKEVFGHSDADSIIINCNGHLYKI